MIKKLFRQAAIIASLIAAASVQANTIETSAFTISWDETVFPMSNANLSILESFGPGGISTTGNLSFSMGMLPTGLIQSSVAGGTDSLGTSGASIISVAMKPGWGITNSSFGMSGGYALTNSGIVSVPTQLNIDTGNSGMPTATFVQGGSFMTTGRSAIGTWSAFGQSALETIFECPPPTFVCGFHTIGTPSSSLSVSFAQPFSVSTPNSGDLAFLSFVGGSFNFVATRVETSTSPVPEPETYAMMLAGLAIVALASRRRN